MRWRRSVMHYRSDYSWLFPYGFSFFCWLTWCCCTSFPIRRVTTQIEISRRPNLMQRALHRILMLRPVTAILIPTLHRADTLTWKWNRGRFSLTSALAGLPTCKVTTIGAKSKLPRMVPLVGLPDGEKIVLIASNFGQAHHPA